jgi:CRP-like cAMP-binding protein
MIELQELQKVVYSPEGETVVAQGSKDQDFYIIVSGEFSVRHNDVKVKDLKMGDMFGEYASIEDSVRNSTVTSKMQVLF